MGSRRAKKMKIMIFSVKLALYHFEILATLLIIRTYQIWGMENRKLPKGMELLFPNVR